MAKEQGFVGFTGLLDLASQSFGGRVVGANDDFFAEAENLIKPDDPVFLPDEFTERGKWMDGWESRRKRVAGHDLAIVRLGVAGRIRAVDVDTRHFLGNHPPYASLEAVNAAEDADFAALEQLEWETVVPQSPLGPGRQNLFASQSGGVFTHVRLSIFPDGGVARLRVWGDAEPALIKAPPRDADLDHRLQQSEVDLAAAQNGGLALACSDSFFGPMNNLIAPGRAVNMGGGWETKRRRSPGYDWILLRLAAPGRVGMVEIDTNHFKGNFPDRAALRGIRLASGNISELLQPGAAWETILDESKLAAHQRHFFREQIQSRGPFSHVRLDIYPDGGVSRLRVFGKVEG